MGLSESEVIQRVYVRLERHLGRELPSPPEFYEPYPVLPIKLKSWHEERLTKR
jgi:hypothetical protein